MFDAARAALLTQGCVREQLKSHGGVISAFGLHFVKAGLVSRAVGKAINDVQEIRLVADYLPQAVPRDKADWAVRQAATFIDCVMRLPAVAGAMRSRPQEPT